MSLPEGAVAVVVISFIFCPLALLALFSRLWSRRIMKVKLCWNDFAVILAMVTVSELKPIKDLLSTNIVNIQ